MKKFWVLILALLAVGITITSFKGQGDKNPVLMYDGKYVFLNSIPSQPHDTVFSMKTMVWSDNPRNALPAVMKKALKEAKKRNVEFDGIITGPAQRDYVIKFKK